MMLDHPKDRLINASLSWLLKVSMILTAAALSACTTQPGFVCRVPAAPLPVSASSQQSEAVFDAPDQASFIASLGDSSLPEDTRRDVALGVGRGDFAPLEATSQWPSQPQPDISQLRIIYLPVRTNSSYIEVPVFRPTRPYGSSRRHGSSDAWWHGPRSVHPQQY